MSDTPHWPPYSDNTDAVAPLNGQLEASWARSRAHGLDPAQPLPDGTLMRAELRDQLEANAKLVTFSRPVIENLFRQIDCPTSTVLLTDRNGLILSALGDTGFLDRAAQVALTPGAEWSEATMGTNAIGTALATQRLSTIKGNEHFLARNRFLTCVATPILAPGGGIAGVIDISTDTRDQLDHAHALLRTTAEFIEHRLVEHNDDGFLVLHFHSRVDMLGTPFEAVALFDEEGQLSGSNRAARSLLQLDDTSPIAYYEQVFSLPWAALVDRAQRARGQLFQLFGMEGATFIAHTRLHAARWRQAEKSPRASAPPPPTQPVLTADTLATTDIPITSASAGPILISGETGTGKRHWAQQFHQQHYAQLPFICLDCSAGQADWPPPTHGVVLLTEFDALPPESQQAWLAAHSVQRLILAATRLPLDSPDSTQRLALDTLQAAQGRSLRLAPLRERADFDSLVTSLAKNLADPQAITFHPAALARLRQYAWPGNLTELVTQLRLILALAGPAADMIIESDLPEELFDTPLR